MMVTDHRRDHRTADNVMDALRARGVHPAALAMEHQGTALRTALRVLTMLRKRRRPCAR
jgi:hypothetical protein